MKSHLSGAVTPVIVLFMALAVNQGCAPVFQDARLVPARRAEITPSFSGSVATAEGETEYLANTFGVQAQFGVHESFNIGVAYARFQDESGEGGVNAIGFGPKIGVEKDRFALALPVSLAFGEDIDVADTFQLHPTALVTVPINPNVDFNPSARLLIPFCDGCDILVGLNAGFGFRPGGGRITLRPEAGAVFSPGESGIVWVFGLGVSIRDR
jgi:hypothetical protein